LCLCLRPKSENEYLHATCQAQRDERNKLFEIKQLLQKKNHSGMVHFGTDIREGREVWGRERQKVICNFTIQKYRQQAEQHLIKLR